MSGAGSSREDMPLDLPIAAGGKAHGTGSWSHKFTAKHV
jgi:hypothetical protein